MRAAAGLYREHGSDPGRLRATVRALVTMNVHSLLAVAADATDADLDQLVDTLSGIWARATLPVR